MKVQTNGYANAISPAKKHVDPEEAVFREVVKEANWYVVGQIEKRTALTQQALELVATCPQRTIDLCRALIHMLSRGTQIPEMTAINIGGVNFAERAELRKYCRNLLDSLKEGEVLDQSHLNFVRGLLGHHPRGPEKAHGAKAFTKMKHSIKGDAFAVIRAQGQETFSYLRCVDCVPTEEVKTQDMICELLVKIMQMNPDACMPVAQLITEKFPFIKGSNIFVEKHRNWTRSLLSMANMLPPVTETLLFALIKRVIEVDTAVGKLAEAMDEMDDTQPCENKVIPLFSSILDVMMLRLFEFLQRRLDSPKTVVPTSQVVCIQAEDHMFRLMLAILDHTVLTTHRTRHVQFLYFYIASLRPNWTELILTLLLQQSYAQDKPLHKRLICMSYLASFVSRAKFLTTKYTLRTTLYLARFAQSHLQAAEERINDGELTHPSVILFLASTQACCYIICWHADAFAAEPDETYQNGLKKLLTPWGHGEQHKDSLTPVLESSCRPFSRIQPSIAKQLLRVIKAHVPEMHVNLRPQIPRAQERSRNFTLRGFDGDVSRLIDDDDEDEEDRAAGLAMFFPFDPYRLKHSEVFVRSQYKVYEGPKEEDSDAESDSEHTGFQNKNGDASRKRAMSQLPHADDDSEESSVVDVEEAEQGSTARGFVPSVGPSPSFRPVRHDVNMQVSPMVMQMDGMSEDDQFSLPPPSVGVCSGCQSTFYSDEVFCRRCGKQRDNPNAFLDSMLNTPAYGIGRA